MKSRGIITLITDFGSADWYAGAVKGAILSVNPSARIFDVTHGIPPGDIVAAALALKNSYCCYPGGTVHVVVVDPGVGSDRRILAARWRGHLFLAPDNGILPLALGDDSLSRAHAVSKKEFRHSGVSDTFHGRDIFAPVAARLAGGASPGRFGPLCKRPVIRTMPLPERISGGGIRGEIIHVDCFGNLMTNAEKSSSSVRWKGPVEIKIRGRVIRGISKTYSSVRSGALLALWGSSGYLEISSMDGSAAKVMGARRGTGFVLKVRRGGGAG